MNLLTVILEFVVESAPVQGAIYALIVAAIGWLVKRWSWTRHVRNLALIAYQYAEDQGVLNELKGLEKLRYFMDKLITEYEHDFGKKPSPEAVGEAIKTMEQQVLKEHTPVVGK